jgi:hypothetical protein
MHYILRICVTGSIAAALFDHEEYVAKYQHTDASRQDLPIDVTDVVLLDDNTAACAGRDGVIRIHSIDSRGK